MDKSGAASWGSVGNTIIGVLLQFGNGSGSWSTKQLVHSVSSGFTESMCYNAFSLAGTHGMTIRESSTGKFIFFYTQSVSGSHTLYMAHVASNTSAPNNVQPANGVGWVIGSPSQICLQITDSGGYFNFYYSTNGVNWNLVTSELRTAYLATFDQVGYGGQSLNTAGAPAGMTIYHSSGTVLQYY